MDHAYSRSRYVQIYGSLPVFSGIVRRRTKEGFYKTGISGSSRCGGKLRRKLVRGRRAASARERPTWESIRRARASEAGRRTLSPMLLFPCVPPPPRLGTRSPQLTGIDEVGRDRGAKSKSRSVHSCITELLSATFFRQDGDAANWWAGKTGGRTRVVTGSRDRPAASHYVLEQDRLGRDMPWPWASSTIMGTALRRFVVWAGLGLEPKPRRRNAKRLCPSMDRGNRK